MEYEVDNQHTMMELGTRLEPGDSVCIRDCNWYGPSCWLYALGIKIALIDTTSSAGRWTGIWSFDRKVWYLFNQDTNFPKSGYTLYLGENPVLESDRALTPAEAIGLFVSEPPRLLRVVVDIDEAMVECVSRAYHVRPEKITEEIMSIVISDFVKFYFNKAVVNQGLTKVVKLLEEVTDG